MDALSLSIMQTEVAGACAFRSSFDRLPLRTRDTDPRIPLEDMLLAMGFGVGDPLADEVFPSRAPLFVAVTPPAGWTLSSLDDPYLTAVLDTADRERARVAYKASYHDRHAYITIWPRYEIQCVRTGGLGRETEPETERWTVFDRREGVTVHAVETLAVPAYDEANPGPYDAYLRRWVKCREDCRAWIAANFPDANPTAYWG